MRLKQRGRRALHAKDYGGLYFFTDNNKFYQFSTDVGGGIIDFVMHFEGKSFLEAVESLVGSNNATYCIFKEPKAQKEKGELELPEKSDNIKRIEWYLEKIRGIYERMR